eukprot:g11758.t1
MDGIRNLSEDVTSEQLREAVEPYGTIHAVFLKTDDMGKNRGVGFVVPLAIPMERIYGSPMGRVWAIH